MSLIQKLKSFMKSKPSFEGSHAFDSGHVLKYAHGKDGTHAAVSHDGMMGYRFASALQHADRKEFVALLHAIHGSEGHPEQLALKQKLLHQLLPDLHKSKANRERGRARIAPRTPTPPTSAPREEAHRSSTDYTDPRDPFTYGITHQFWE